MLQIVGVARDHVDQSALEQSFRELVGAFTEATQQTLRRDLHAQR
jgi:hypothetical protein